MLLSSSLLVIAAAADLAPLESALKRAIREQIGFACSFSFSSSGALARQIRQGAPFDVFLSANEPYVRALADDGYLVPGTVRVYAEGRIALWSKRGYRTLDDLTRPEVRHVALANPEHAPYGLAARQALQAAGLWERLRPKIVYGENVRQAWQFAQTGNADAAIVSHSLAGPSGVLLDRSSHAPIRQAAGAVARSARRGDAARVVEWLCGARGQALLRGFGFHPTQAR